MLAKAWILAKEGQHQLVLLAGELGIGKTRLAAEMARAAHADGATVLFGFCDEDVTLPYRPFVDALRHYVAHAALGPGDSVLKARLLGQLAVELASGLSGTDGTRSRLTRWTSRDASVIASDWPMC